jgi:hypothetical protein
MLDVMTLFLRMLWLSLLGLCLASCSECKPSAKAPCTSVGQRIGEQPVRGIIYGSVGHKAYVKAYPGVKLPFAFIGPEPADFKRLEQLAETREDVLGFNALGDGYIVADGPGRYVLLLITLSNVREDPSVAKAREPPPANVSFPSKVAISRVSAFDPFLPLARLMLRR